MKIVEFIEFFHYSGKKSAIKIFPLVRPMQVLLLDERPRLLCVHVGYNIDCAYAISYIHNLQEKRFKKKKFHTQLCMTCINIQ